LDAATAELVRFRFSFTPAAYRDAQVEDISVVLEHALVEGRHWLPFRQEIEIRRRNALIDFPIRTIIRGRWEIEDYTFNVPLPPDVLAGASIGGLRGPASAEVGWAEPLETAIAGVA